MQFMHNTLCAVKDFQLIPPYEHQTSEEVVEYKTSEEVAEGDTGKILQPTRTRWLLIYRDDIYLCTSLA